MRGEKPTKMLSKSGKHRSLTEQILTLCASGHFGVREAIATALERVNSEETGPASPNTEKESGILPRQE